MNKVILIGNLTRDVELKTIATGKPVATCGIATSRKYKTQTGDVKEAVQFHNLVIWGKSAEIFKMYLSKGKKVMVEGELQHRTYDKADGTKGYATEINVREFEFLTPKGTGAPAPAAAPATTPAADGRDEAGYSARGPMPEAPPEEEIRVEDIPF